MASIKSPNKALYGETNLSRKTLVISSLILSVLVVSSFSQVFAFSPFSFNYSQVAGAGQVDIFGYFFPSIVSGALLIYWQGQLGLSVRFDYEPSPAPFGTLTVRVFKCVAPITSCTNYYEIARTLNDIYGTIKDINQMIEWVLNFYNALYVAGLFWDAISQIWNSLYGRLIESIGTLNGTLNSFAAAVSSGSFAAAWSQLAAVLQAAETVGIMIVGIVLISGAIALVPLA